MMNKSDFTKLALSMGYREMSPVIEYDNLVYYNRSNKNKDRTVVFANNQSIYVYTKGIYNGEPDGIIKFYPETMEETRTALIKAKLLAN